VSLREALLECGREAAALIPRVNQYESKFRLEGSKRQIPKRQLRGRTPKSGFAAIILRSGPRRLRNRQAHLRGQT